MNGPRFSFFFSLGLLLLPWPSTASGPLDTNLQGSRKVEFLLTRLESAGDYKVRLAAADALGRIADGTVADWMLRAFRKESNEAVRLATLYAVGRIPDSGVLPPILELSQDELLSEAELIALERVVWSLREAVAVAEWTKALLDSVSREERALAAYLLGLVGDPSVFPALRAALSDPSAYVRVRAVQGLGRIGVSAGLAYCQTMAQRDPDSTVRRAAQTCAGEIRMNRSEKIRTAHGRRVHTGADLRGLRTASMTPDTMRRYWKKNVNPREIEEALTVLRPEATQQREDRTFPLVRSETLRRTFHYEAEMVTYYRFQTADLEKLREGVRDRVGYVNRCYLAEQKRNRKLAGQVRARFIVLKTGDVSTVEITGSTLRNEAAQSCMVKEILGFKFPELPLRYVTMNYTFVFEPPKDQKINFTTSSP